jgi:hypothetical protein
MRSVAEILFSLEAGSRNLCVESISIREGKPPWIPSGFRLLASHIPPLFGGISRGAAPWLVFEHPVGHHVRDFECHVQAHADESDCPVRGSDKRLLLHQTCEDELRSQAIRTGGLIFFQVEALAVIELEISVDDRLPW